MFRKLPAVTVLACLLSGCGSIMKPSALPNPAPGHSAGSKTPGSVGADRAADAAGTSGTGVQPDALTTPEDILAHIRDYGWYCRRLEAGYRALITLHN